MGCAVPSLTIDGFITNKRLMIHKIWDYILESDYSQSNVFFGKITSFKYLLATNTPPFGVKDALESFISNCYKKYYSDVTCTVNVEDTGNDSTFRVEIALAIVEDNKTYHLYDEIQYTNGKIETYNNKLTELYGEE